MVNVVCLREALASRDTSLCQNPGLRLTHTHTQREREREREREVNIVF